MDHKERKFSFYRLFGICDVCIVGILGFMLMGGNPWALFVLSAWCIVLGVTCFSLLAVYKSDFINFCFDAFLALFSESQPNKAYVEIAESGGGYARKIGVIGFIFYFTPLLDIIDGPIKELGHHLAAAIVVLLMSIFLSEILFPYLSQSFRSKNESLPAPQSAFSFYFIFAVVPAVLAGLLWFYVMITTPPYHPW